MARGLDRDRRGRGAAGEGWPPSCGLCSRTAGGPWSTGPSAGWERRLWDFERPDQHLGWHGGGGLGYGLGASIGAALALDRDTLCLNLQPDGDLLYTPSALWTMASAQLPVLTVLHNNRQYGNTVGHARRIAQLRKRTEGRERVGAGLDDPVVDYATMARGFGVHGIGPVTRPEDIQAAVKDALSVVDSGAPALVDVVTTGPVKRRPGLFPHDRTVIQSAQRQRKV